MIPLTKLDGQKLVINGDLVERIEAIPDTIISLTSGRKVMVRESMGEVMSLMNRYHHIRRDDLQLLPVGGMLLADPA